MDLPPAADAMYKTWWSFVSYAASTISTETGRVFSAAETQEAASDISRTVGGAYAGYNPIGLSQLYGVARSIARATDALTAADDASPIGADMVAEPPWSRSVAEQAALSLWQARAQITYTDASGATLNGFQTIQFTQVLPSSVGSLRAQVALRAQDMLSTPPTGRSPKTGTLVSVGNITLLTV